VSINISTILTFQTSSDIYYNIRGFFMIKCEICELEFKNNLGGDLTKHLKLIHQLSMEDYYVKTVLNNIEPKCKCGLCDERPYFNRGKFSKYALGHEKFEWQEMMYIELYGHPKCQNPECDEIVKFHRGKPNKYCSFKCHPNNWNQNKVKNTVNKKYNVDNVFQLPNIKQKLKLSLIKKYGVEHPLQSNILLNKMTSNNIIKYGVEYPQMLPNIREKQKATLIKRYGVNHYSKTKEFRELSSKNMCKYNQNILTNHTIKRYKDTKLYYQSKYELKFLEFCEKKNILMYISNSPTFKYINKNYGKWHLPDFKFKDKFIIEIKSTYWMNKQGGIDVINAKKESVEIKGYNYIFLLDEDFDDFIKII